MARLTLDKQEMQNARQTSEPGHVSQEWIRDTVKGITYETEPLGIGGQHIFFNVPLKFGL